MKLELININPLNANPTKRSNILYGYVWPFCRVGAQRFKKMVYLNSGKEVDNYGEP